jgi:hypothetical protein
MSTLPHAPATHRNREPIWNTISPYLSSAKKVLEIASGTGEHIEFMAQKNRKIQWQPSDGNPNMIWAIDARLDQHPNVSPAKHIDVCSGDWGNLSYDVLFCANMIHISPWESSIGLFSDANPEQYLILYGPFMDHGVHNSQGNAQFDMSLKSRDPRWGIRDLQDIIPLAAKNGFVLHKQHPMPANNFTLIWKRT